MPSPTTDAQTLSSIPGEDDGGAIVCFYAHEMVPVGFNPSGAEIVIRSAEGFAGYDLATGTQTWQVNSPAPVVTAALSPSNSHLAWSLANGELAVLGVPMGEIVQIQTDLLEPSPHLLFSPSGDVLYASSHNGLVHMWKTSDGTELTPLDVGSEIVGMGVSADGELLAIVPADGPLTLWNVNSRMLVQVLGGTGGYDTSQPVFSPGGDYVAADLATGVFVWRLADGEQLAHPLANSMSVAFSPDGRWLATSDIDAGNEILLLAPDGSKVLRQLDGFQGPVWELFFSPEGDRLAATDGMEIRVWDVMTGRLIATGAADCR